MGWVSMLEDAVTRFEDELHRLRKDPEISEGMAPIEKWRSVTTLFVNCKKVLSEAERYLDTATDPDVELSRELEIFKSHVRELKSKVRDYSETSHSLARHLRDREDEIKSLRKANKELKTENNQLSKKLDLAMRSNPGAVYDQYMKGAKIGK